jgi:hypothetical protein
MPTRFVNTATSTKVPYLLRALKVVGFYLYLITVVSPAVRGSPQVSPPDKT